MEHETHLVVHKNDAQTQMCVHPLKYAVKWDTVRPMKVISAALTNEQKMAVFTYSINVKCTQSHFACIHLSVSVCIHASERDFGPPLLCYCPTYVWTQQSVFRNAWDWREQGRSLGKCKLVEWISRSKCRLCIKLYKGHVPTKEDAAWCGSLCLRSDWGSSLCCARCYKNGL